MVTTWTHFTLILSRSWTLFRSGVIDDLSAEKYSCLKCNGLNKSQVFSALKSLGVEPSLTLTGEWLKKLTPSVIGWHFIDLLNLQRGYTKLCPDLVAWQWTSLRLFLIFSTEFNIQVHYSHNTELHK